MMGNVIPFDTPPRLRLCLTLGVVDLTRGPDAVPTVLYQRTGMALHDDEWAKARGLIRDLAHEVREFERQDRFMARIDGDGP